MGRPVDVRPTSTASAWKVLEWNRSFEVAQKSGGLERTSCSTSTQIDQDSPGSGATAGTGSAAASPAAIGGGIAGALLLAALAGIVWTGRLPWPGRAAKNSVSGGASLMGGSDRGAYGAVAA